MRTITGEMRSFVWGLAGVLVGVLMAGLLLSVLPAQAATGDTMIVGRANQAGLATKIRSVGPSTLKIINTRTTGVGLDIYTKPGQPPFQVNRAAWVQNLNADLLDTRHATQLLPIVESCSNDNIPDGTSWDCEVTIVTPHPGTLVIAASVDARYLGTTSDRMWCRLYVDRNNDADDSGDLVKYSDRDISVGVAAEDTWSICATNAAVARPAGTQVIRFLIDGIANTPPNDYTDVGEGSMWVMWIPD